MIVLPDENTSLWMANKPPYARQPALRARITADVAIVGGGFTGVSTAWHLARRHPDKRIVLLEARQLAGGASGRNGGLMLNWIAGVHSPDPEHARRIYDVTQLGMAIIAEMIDRHALDVPHHRDGALEVFTDPRRADDAAARVEAYRAAGIPLSLLDGEALRRHLQLASARAAILDPRAGHLDGVAMLRAMRPVLLDLGVAIYEDTPVTRIDEGPRIAVATPDGRVDAGAVVLATGAYTPALGYFGDRMFPLLSHVVATAPQPAGVWADAGYPGHLGFSDDLDRIAYGGLTQNGALVFGGGSNGAYSYRYGGRTHAAAPRGHRAVARRLHRYLPRTRDIPIAHRWTGALCITLSRVCAMGVRGAHRNVYYAFGFSGHGIVMAHLAGRVLADIHDGDDARWRDLPFFEPRLHRIPGEPLRWLGYHAFTLFTGRSPRRAH